jgi:hypothetical protein
MPALERMAVRFEEAMVKIESMERAFREVMSSTASIISHRLGPFFEQEARAFIQANLKNVSPWCELFTDAHSKKLDNRQADIYCYCQESS